MGSFSTSKCTLILLAYDDMEWKKVESNFYRAFHRFGQAKFPDGGSVFWPSAFKNDAQFKSGQNWLKNKQLALLI